MIDRDTYLHVLYETQLEFEKITGKKFKNFVISTAFRYLFELQLLEKYSPSKRILEVGAAPFVFTVLAKKFGYEITSLDLNPEIGKKIIDYYQLDVHKVDIQKDRFPFEDKSFDYVHFSEVFEHLYVNPFFTLSEIHRVLSDTGVMLLSTPNFYSADNLWRCLTGRGFRDGFEEFRKLLELGYIGHVREYTRQEMEKFLNFANFKVVDYYLKFYHKTRYKLLNLIFKLFPKLRPIQIFICEKN